MFLSIFLHDNPNFWGDDKTHTRKKIKKRIDKKYKGVCLLSSTNSNFSEKCDSTHRNSLHRDDEHNPKYYNEYEFNSSSLKEKILGSLSTPCFL